MDRIQMAQAGMSLDAIAEAEGVSTTAIRKWFYRRGLTYQLLKPPHFETVPRGYERVSHKYDTESRYVSVHRLAAVAWFGVDAVAGNHVHHENGIPWDNREENLQVLPPGEHAEKHTDGLLDQDFEDRDRRPDGAWR
jgi:hypothetical protein